MLNPTKVTRGITASVELPFCPCICENLLSMAGASIDHSVIALLEDEATEEMLRSALSRQNAKADAL